MACCMFAAFIVGHIVLMWRSIMTRWFPARAAALAARTTASAWRPGMEAAPVPLQQPGRRLMPRTLGMALIFVSVAYFGVQAKAALEQADDAQSFAVLLAQNICRVAPAPADNQLPIQVAVAQSKVPK